MSDPAQSEGGENAGEGGNAKPSKLKIALAVAALVAVVVGVKFLPVDQWTRSLQVWVESLGWWGPIAFAAIYVLMALLLIPASALTIAAGVIFGLAGGFVLVSIASTTAAAVALLIARYAAREKVAGLAASNAKFAAVDRAVAQGGWKIVAMLRLSPAVPFNLLNYMLGLTSIPFGRCVLTSWIAMMPGTLLYVYLGYLGRSTAGGGKSPLEWALLAVGLLATVAVTVYLTKLAKRELKSETDVQ